LTFQLLEGLAWWRIAPPGRRYLLFGPGAVTLGLVGCLGEAFEELRIAHLTSRVRLFHSDRFYQAVRP
jgi:hypothetical protein